MDHANFLRRAVALSKEGMHRGGLPFGAVVVLGGDVLGEACNEVVETNDPTAHAEIIAIRRAAKRLAKPDLGGCILYTSAEPCPMCLAAAYWARIERIFHGSTLGDAADAGFDDGFILEELRKPRDARCLPTEELLRNEAKAVLRGWAPSAPSEGQRQRRNDPRRNQTK